MKVFIDIEELNIYNYDLAHLEITDKLIYQVGSELLTRPFLRDSLQYHCKNVETIDPITYNPKPNLVELISLDVVSRDDIIKIDDRNHRIKELLNIINGPGVDKIIDEIINILENTEVSETVKDIRTYRLCEHCNKEFELNMIPSSSDGFTSTIQSCSHCNKRNDIWVRIIR